ncbi:TolB family protein [Marinoscillum sp.]|uniref:TolB family protein n=1 Tax=Marinoscillum sp. TaxID=2024838 RepID=UPI003BADA80C
MKILSLVIILIFTIPFCSCQERNNDYLRVIDSLQIGNGLTIHWSKNVILFSRPTGQINQLTGNPIYKIFQIKKINNGWTQSDPLDTNSSYNDYHPVFSPNGHWLYFNSTRPRPGEVDPSTTANIWRVSYDDNKWGTPEYLSGINSENHESYPSITNEGHLYFNSDRPGGKGSMDIYKSEWKNGQFEEPQPVVSLNTPDSENDLFIDPQERFIVFNRYLFESKEIELYISFRDEQTWTKPQPLTPLNTTGSWELTPVISPEGMYLFYELDGRVKRMALKDLVEPR